ncbi:MAG TPA: hypothetical protein VMN83_25715 [Albitalea sp.]|nr:hypothetical protein [Albitalea sp.]HUG25912.1 hypothetical protein [Albitalea sp.]
MLEKFRPAVGALYARLDPSLVVSQHDLRLDLAIADAEIADEQLGRRVALLGGHDDDGGISAADRAPVRDLPREEVDDLLPAEAAHRVVLVHDQSNAVARHGKAVQAAFLVGQRA